MVVAILVIFLLALAWVGVMGLGMVLAWRGARGELVDRAPRCRRCGYLVLSCPHRPARCSECGAGLLGPGAVRLGARRRRGGLLAAGLAILGGGGSLLWYVLLPQAQATPAVRKIARPVIRTIRPRARAPFRAQAASDLWFTAVPKRAPQTEASPTFDERLLPAACINGADLPFLDRALRPPRFEIDVAAWIGEDPAAALPVLPAGTVTLPEQPRLPRIEAAGPVAGGSSDSVLSGPLWNLDSLFASPRAGRGPLRLARVGGSMPGGQRVEVEPLTNRLIQAPLAAERIEPPLETPARQPAARPRRGGR